MCRRLDITDVVDDIATHDETEAVASLRPIVVALARLGQHKQNNSQSGLPIGFKRRGDKYFLLYVINSALYRVKIILRWCFNFIFLQKNHFNGKITVQLVLGQN